MRPIIASLVFCIPSTTFGQDVTRAIQPIPKFSQDGEFRLGGAAMRAATTATGPLSEPDDPVVPRLTLPLNSNLDEYTRQESSLGPATVFIVEGLDGGRDALELGTFLSRGQARAGVSVTYLETEAEVARSEVFLDYALTDQFSVGVSGILDAELGDTDPVRQLGLNAEYSGAGGTFVQGGVAGAADYDPVIGLSVGLRF